jgi:D-3-phosphoglycerate dehydrogenase
MYNVLTMNKIAECGINMLPKEKYHVSDDISNPHAVLVRSASMHDMEFGSKLLAVARAGAGVNNIPVEKCSEIGIVVFNTPGANANAVKELVIAGLLLSSRRVIDAVEWAKSLKGKGDEVGKLVEKEKSRFAGPEIAGKTLGVIGLGAIGASVASAAAHLGMEVYGVDPYLSVSKAVNITTKLNYVQTFKEVFEKCDYITLHVPLTKDTEKFINAENISAMKKNVRILNFARGDLIDEPAVIEALNKGDISCYVTDFPTDALIGVNGVIAIPHLGASSPESEDNCAVMAAKEIADYLENGNISNSVNLPDLSLETKGDAKVCIIHRNVKGAIEKITNVIAEECNIESMLNEHKKEYAYTILDVTGNTKTLNEKLGVLDMVLSVRIIQTL